MPQRTQGGPHSLDGGVQRGGWLGLGGLEQGADFDQVLQGGELGSGAALGVAAVGQDLAGDLLGQEAERAGEEAGLFRDRDRCGDKAFEGGERAGIQFLGGQRGGEVARVEHEAGHHALAEHVIGRGGEEVVVGEPGGQAGAGDVRAVGDGVLWVGDPVGDELAGTGAGGIGAKGAQVAQPGEAMRCGAQDQGAFRVAPAARTQVEGGAGNLQFPFEDLRPAGCVTWPGIGDRQRRRVWHAAHPQVGKAGDGAAGVTQPTGTGHQATRAGAAWRREAAGRLALTRDRRVAGDVGSGMMGLVLCVPNATQAGVMDERSGRRRNRPCRRAPARGQDGCEGSRRDRGPRAK